MVADAQLAHLVHLQASSRRRESRQVTEASPQAAAADGPSRQQAHGDMACHLCVQALWQEECRGPAPTTTPPAPTWAMSAENSEARWARVHRGRSCCCWEPYARHKKLNRLVWLHSSSTSPTTCSKGDRGRDSGAPTAHCSLLTAAPNCPFPGLLRPCAPRQSLKTVAYEQPPPSLAISYPPPAHLELLRRRHGVSLDCGHHHFPLKGVVHTHHPGLPLQHQVGVGLAVPAVQYRQYQAAAATAPPFSCGQHPPVRESQRLQLGGTQEHRSWAFQARVC